MKSLTDYSNPLSFASQLRKKRMRRLSELVSYVIKTHSLETLRIVDIGGTTSYWAHFPFHEFPEIKFRLSLINLAYPDYDQAAQLPKDVFVEKLIGNACELGNFENKQWHIAHSNSVIEHVGGWNNITAMAEEIQRVSDYYPDSTSPNRAKREI
jgi:hypothetical protein